MTKHGKNAEVGTIGEALKQLTQQGNKLPGATPFIDSPGVLSSLGDIPVDTAKIPDFMHQAIQFPVSPKRR